jgi:glycerol-3-phosphate acyltransferase PlsY
MPPILGHLINPVPQTLLYSLLGYLLGSLPFAVIVSRLFGLADPRSFGSGNPGATNVLRSGNKLAALLTLLGDACKGWLAVAIAGWSGAEPLALAAAGLAAFIGHVFPLFLRFRGGKGVATAVGVLIGFQPVLALIAMVTWMAVALATRYSSLAAIAAALEVPIAAWLLSERIELTTAIALMSALLIWRHRANIRRLIDRNEPRIGQRKSAS